MDLPLMTGILKKTAAHTHAAAWHLVLTVIKANSIVKAHAHIQYSRDALFSLGRQDWQQTTAEMLDQEYSKLRIFFNKTHCCVTVFTWRLGWTTTYLTRLSG